MLKKVILVMVMVVFICCGCHKGKNNQNVQSDLDAIMNRGKIIVGVKTDSYPFGFLDKKGHHLGFDPTLARLIAKDLFGSENAVKFVNVNASNRMMKLYSNEIDMIIATMSITPKRKEFLDFSMPYHVAGQAILVNKGSRIKNIRDLGNKRTIIVFGSTTEMSLRAAVPNVQIVGYKTYTQAYKALKRGEAEAIVADDSILLSYALNDKDVVLLPKRYSKEPYAIAFRKGPESKQILEAVNNTIKSSIQNGNIKRIKNDLGI